MYAQTSEVTYANAIFRIWYVDKVSSACTARRRKRDSEENKTQEMYRL